MLSSVRVRLRVRVRVRVISLPHSPGYNIKPQKVTTNQCEKLQLNVLAKIN